MKAKHNILFGLGVSTLLAMTLASCGQTASSGGDASSSASSAHTHSFSATYESDETNHWRVCSCGEKDLQAHSFTSEKIVLTKSTKEKAGTKGYKCYVCGYVKDKEEYATAVSAADWDNAFKFAGDFTLTYTETHVSGGSEFTDKDYIYVKNGDIVYSKRKSTDTSYSSGEFYYAKSSADSGEKCYVYTKKDSSVAKDEHYWVKEEDANNTINKYTPFDFNSVFFFSNLSFKNIYEPSYQTVDECYLVTPKNDPVSHWDVYFENGKVKKLVRAGKLRNDSTTYTYTYQISESADQLTLPHGHALSDSYSNDATSHWYACAECDEKVEKSDHDFRNVMDVDSSEAKKVCNVCGYSAVIEDSSDVKFDSFLYGQYPQSRVSDPSLVASLDALTSPAKNGWYLFNNEYYAKKVAAPFDSKYTFDDGTQISSDTTYWFKVEAIEWEILSVENNVYSLASRLLLDAHRYNESYSSTNKYGYYANNYQNSEIRDWLNSDFRDSAFPSYNKLQYVSVDNSADSTGSSSNTYACKDTSDKVYLLSYQDCEKATFSLQCKTTDYARASGAHIDRDTKNGDYWTRSPLGTASNEAWFVTYGVLSHTSVGLERLSVRPAITVSLGK